MCGLAMPACHHAFTFGGGGKFSLLTFLKYSLSSVFSNQATVPGPQEQAKPLENETMDVICGGPRF